VALAAPVSQTPVSYTPNVFEGSSCGTACTPASTIYSTVVVNGEVIVAGAFTEVCTPAATGYAQCPNEVPADFIFAFDPATGAIDPNFAPVLNTGPVYSLAVGPGNRRRVQHGERHRRRGACAAAGDSRDSVH
jgi:hypothetical protein